MIYRVCEVFPICFNHYFNSPLLFCAELRALISEIARKWDWLLTVTISPWKCLFFQHLNVSLWIISVINSPNMITFMCCLFILPMTVHKGFAPAVSSVEMMIYATFRSCTVLWALSTLAIWSMHALNYWANILVLMPLIIHVCCSF